MRQYRRRPAYPWSARSGGVPAPPGPSCLLLLASYPHGSVDVKGDRQLNQGDHPRLTILGRVNWFVAEGKGKLRGYGAGVYSDHLDLFGGIRAGSGPANFPKGHQWKVHQPLRPRKRVDRSLSRSPRLVPSDQTRRGIIEPNLCWLLNRAVCYGSHVTSIV